MSLPGVPADPAGLANSTNQYGAGYEPFEGVSRVAVLRGGGIGDLVMAMPAINALVQAYPLADITLLGMPSHAAILQDRHTCISRVAVLPVAEGIRSGDHAPDPAELTRFVHGLRAQKFDVAVQLHGGGAFSNPLVSSLHATHTVGSQAAGAAALERTVHHQYFQHEVLRGLEVAALAGANPVYHRVQWQATDGETRRAQALLPGPSTERPLVVMHPGARDARRRWPARSFASVAAALVEEGCHIMVVGDHDELALVQEVVDRGRALLSSGQGHHHLLPLAGAMDLGTLCGLLSLSRVLVANDSGPRHVAEALGVPTASIYWAPNLVNAGPLLRARHRVHIAWDTRCPVCGAAAAGQAVPDCGHEGSFVSEVATSAVLENVLDLLRGHL